MESFIFEHKLSEFYKPVVCEKAWGRELLLRNNNKYCGKILQFDKKGAKFSLHYHCKEETWFVKGKFLLMYIDTNNADKKEILLNFGDVVHLYPLIPHQLICLENNSEIYEVSDTHYDYDSRRIEKGDSQNI